MNPERWERIQTLVESALERPEESRQSFLDSACGDDADLRAEVLSLLDACARSAESPALPEAWSELLAGPERPRFLPGDEVAGRYRIVALLGRGGMGEVYEAWDGELSVPVALKTLHLPGETDEARRRLKLEGLLARSVWHPNVCRLYDLGRHGEGADATWFLTMELLRGATLEERRGEGAGLPRELVRRFAVEIAEGLGAAHQAGVVHRDLKPANVMIVTREGREQAVVMDFGIARATASGTWRGEAALILGTPAYMAPEQVRGDVVGPAADIYALGIVLFELLTGTLPFGEGSAAEVARRRLVEDPPSPRTRVPDLEEHWEAIIARCLARDPRERFARAEEVAEALGGTTDAGRLQASERAEGATVTLPAELDVFFGRQEESRDLERRLTGPARLVTLLGAGGMGKTRFAVHFAWRNLASWPGGVWFADLAEARTPEEIAAVVADALRVPFVRGDSIEQIGNALAGHGRCLVILDNVEQAVDHAEATVGRWLGRAREARFLVTSRERLGLGSEESVLTLEPISVEEGVSLFVARARRLQPSFAPLGAEAEAVREIVRLVDGMPLAIELAAARMRMMDAAQIVAQMRRRFSLLTGGASARHETLGVAIDGSWELLQPWERSGWAQCALFEGGFTLEAAEAVIDLRAWPEAPWVVDVVQSLVDKSLLRTWVPAGSDNDDVPDVRFGMFASLQEYARTKLRDDPSVAGTVDVVPMERAGERRHGFWYARLGTREALTALSEHGGIRRRRRSDRELDNLVAAGRRAIARDDAEVAVPTYHAAWAVLELRGPFGVAVELGREILARLRLGATEEVEVLRTLGQAESFSGLFGASRDHLEAALARAHEVADPRLEALVLGSLGGLAVIQGRMDEGSPYLEMALEAAGTAGDRHQECSSLSTLSVARRGQGRTEVAREHAERALEIARSVGNRRLEGSILSNLGLVLQDQGRIDAARAHLEMALAVHREVGNRRFEGNARNSLGALEYGVNRTAEARVHWEAALALHRATGSRDLEAVTLTNLGALAHRDVRFEDADARFRDALAIVRELGNRRLEGAILGALATLCQDRGEIAPARAHFESAVVLQREVGARAELARLLCLRGEFAFRQGEVQAAAESLQEAEDLVRTEAGADTTLTESLVALRRKLETAAR